MLALVQPRFADRYIWRSRREIARNVTAATPVMITHQPHFRDWCDVWQANLPQAADQDSEQPNERMNAAIGDRVAP